MKSNEKRYDDLTVITGIGDARQRWLRESFDVRTYRDLAALTVDEIESRLMADGQIPSRKAIEAWLVQARERAAGKEADSPPREDGWEPFASFVVEFQIRDVEGQPEERRTAVHHVEKDLDKHWSGIEGRKLCQWMLDGIRDRVALAPGEERVPVAQPVEAPPVEQPPARTQISRMRVFQPPQSEVPIHTVEAGKPFEGILKADEPFRLEVDFELRGLAAAAVAGKRIECSAQSYAYDQATHTSIHLGDTAPRTFVEGKLADTVTLPEAFLEHGDYRLVVLATPQAGLAVPDYIEVEQLHVA